MRHVQYKALTVEFEKFQVSSIYKTYLHTHCSCSRLISSFTITVVT